MAAVGAILVLLGIGFLFGPWGILVAIGLCLLGAC